MNAEARPITILLAEDDDDDRLLAVEALEESHLGYALHCVENGKALLGFLRDGPRPDVILLDLNMPCKDGREVLAELKQDADLRSIPVVVLTTSGAEEDLDRSRELGVNGFVTKPVRFEALVEVMHGLERYRPFGPRS